MGRRRLYVPGTQVIFTKDRSTSEHILIGKGMTRSLILAPTARDYNRCLIEFKLKARDNPRLTKFKQLAELHELPVILLFGKWKQDDHCIKLFDRIQKMGGATYDCNEPKKHAPPTMVQC